jgi:hypothetical protein
MNQQAYRHLLALVRSASLELNENYDPSYDRVSLLTRSGEVVPVDEDTDETILGMEIGSVGDGYVSLWVIDGLGRCAAYPEVGVGSSVDHLLGALLTYNLPVVCDTPEALARLVILGE